MRHELPNNRARRNSDSSVVQRDRTHAIPSSGNGNALTKTAPGWLSARFSRQHAPAEARPGETVSSMPLKNRDDLIELRPIKRPSKLTAEENAVSSVITINVSGDRFQTYLSTLTLYPNTLLGNDHKRKHFWNPKTNEYFFDRHRACFEAILYYYQSQGRLRRPNFVPIDTFLEEIAFFELGHDATTQVHQTENVKQVEETPMPKALWRRYIWFYCEYPQHSTIARVINLVSTLFTILSCVSLAIESLPDYTNHWDNICKEQANVSLNSTYVPRCPALFTSPFFLIQTICVAFFTIEFFLRFISTPSYLRFIFSFFNWVDLSAIVPYYVFLGFQLADEDISLNTNAILGIRILRILRFSRIFKIYLVFRRLKSLRVLSATVKESLMDFAVLITILALVAFLFGAATYFVEQQENGDVFDSIPRATYWGIITMTGVGYGDMYPVTPAGRIITCLCALCGPATMGMLISVLVDRYQRVYNRKMYIQESETSSIDLDMMTNPDDDIKSCASSRKTLRRQDFSAVLSHQLSSFHGKIKHDQHQSNKFQFVLSLNDKKATKEDTATDRIVTLMKKKMAEAIALSDVDVDLKLVDSDSKELWTISSSPSMTVDTSVSHAFLGVDDAKQSRVHMF